MSDHSLVAADPFTRSGRLAGVAGHLRCTEGQLYTMGLGLLLVAAVSVHALPHVAWEQVRPAPATSQFALQPTEPAAVPAPTGTDSVSSDAVAPPPDPAFSPLDGGIPSDGPSSTSPGSSGAPAPGPPPIDEGDGPSIPPAAGELRVTGGGYASADAGTPFATLGIPEGSVAVARRLGGPDKISFLRVEGQGTELALEVDPNGANAVDALADLRLCIITDARWEVGQGDVAIDDAPAYDCSNLVEGARSDAGDTWTFALGTLDTEALSGVAIVPAEEPVAPDFQVVFRLVAANGAGS